MWCDKGNRIIINKYWPGFSDEKDTLRIHNLFYLVFLLSHWMNWLNITFPCLGFSIDVWRGASLIYSVEKKKSEWRRKKNCILRLFKGVPEAILPCLFMWLGLIALKSQQIRFPWLQSAFIQWECFQNSSIWRKHDWESSLFLVPKLYWAAFSEKLIVSCEVDVYHCGRSACSLPNIQKQNSGGEKPPV